MAIFGVLSEGEVVGPWFCWMWRIWDGLVVSAGLVACKNVIFRVNLKVCVHKRRLEWKLFHDFDFVWIVFVDGGLG